MPSRSNMLVAAVSTSLSAKHHRKTDETRPLTAQPLARVRHGLQHSDDSVCERSITNCYHSTRAHQEGFAKPNQAMPCVLCVRSHETETHLGVWKGAHQANRPPRDLGLCPWLAVSAETSDRRRAAARILPEQHDRANSAMRNPSIQMVAACFGKNTTGPTSSLVSFETATSHGR